MNTIDDISAANPSAHLSLIQMGMGCWVSRLVYAAAELGLADQLANGAKSADQLAASTGTHAPSLHRLMRSLAGLGVLHEREGQGFALTVVGEALKTGAPGAARATLALSRRALGVEELGRNHVFAPDRRARLRQGVRHAGLRASVAASRRGL